MRLAPWCIVLLFLAGCSDYRGPEDPITRAAHGQHLSGHDAPKGTAELPNGTPADKTPQPPSRPAPPAPPGSPQDATGASGNDTAPGSDPQGSPASAPSSSPSAGPAPPPHSSPGSPPSPAPSPTPSTAPPSPPSPTPSPPAPGPAPTPTPAPATPAPPPAAISVAVSHQHLQQFQVAWNVPAGASSSRVEYGTSTAYGSTTASVNGTGAQSIVITGLQENTQYHLRVWTYQGALGNVTADATAYTATRIVIHIVAQSDASSFNPAHPVAPAGRPLVLQVTNDLPQSHTYQVIGGPGATPPIAPGQTYTSSSSFVLSNGAHTQKCTLHPSTMTGTGSFQVT